MQSLQPATTSDKFQPRTARRKRGICLLRRTGQSGSVFQRGKNWNPGWPAYGRFYVDLPDGTRQRKKIALGVCRTKTAARRKLREYIAVNKINDPQTFYQATAAALTFRKQAEAWVQSLHTRRRKPLKPATILNWQHALDKWVLPALGDMPLADVGNAAMRSLVDKLMNAGLSAKTVINYTAVVKLVAASAVNPEGDQLYPRTWNAEYIGMPIVKKTDQHRPTITQTQVETAIISGGRWRVLFALLAGTGLRAGEALALRSEDLSADCSVIKVRRSIWRGKEQSPKTENAIRDVNICIELAAMLREFVGGRSGFLFRTRTGRPLSQRNVLAALHRAVGKIGLHAFRRFRTETLRRARVPGDLERFWLGHAGTTVTDLYAQGLQHDDLWRREWCERAGLGFSLVGHSGPQTDATIFEAKAA